MRTLVHFMHLHMQTSYWIRKSQQQSLPWRPRAGDIIVSNWVSWIELLWLAFRYVPLVLVFGNILKRIFHRFDPIFVLPIPESLPAASITPQPSTPITHTPGRRTGTGSANVQSPRRATNARIPIVGYREVSLLSIIQCTGQVPPFGGSASDSSLRTLEDIRKHADRPVVVFPECTTSNGRGLLRFADVFGEKVPVKSYQVYVMCVRYVILHACCSLAIQLHFSQQIRSSDRLCSHLDAIYPVHFVQSYCSFIHSRHIHLTSDSLYTLAFAIGFSQQSTIHRQRGHHGVCWRRPTHGNVCRLNCSNRKNEKNGNGLGR